VVFRLPESGLQGAGVTLKPLTQEDAAGLWELGQQEPDPRVFSYMLSTPLDPQAVPRALELARAGSQIPLTVWVSGELAGSTRFMELRPQHRGLEIGGTWYGSRFRGSGLNLVCKYLMMQLAFGEWGAIRVQIVADRRNLRSRRAIEGLGALQEAVLRQHMVLPNGELRDTAVYSLLDREWPKRSAELRRAIALRWPIPLSAPNS
jgi:aminoglycoside 6'-N-acetyltransferase